jgi:hypothetical protein
MNPSPALEEDELTIEFLKKEIEKDIPIKSSDLQAEIVNTPQLFSKYYNYLSRIKKALKKEKFILHKVVNKRSEYYLGKGTFEDYQKEPFGLKILKADLQRYLQSDIYVFEQECRVDAWEDKKTYLEQVISSHINFRANAIKTILEWQKFSQGVS